MLLCENSTASTKQIARCRVSDSTHNSKLSVYPCKLIFSLASSLVSIVFVSTFLQFPSRIFLAGIGKIVRKSVTIIDDRLADRFPFGAFRAFECRLGAPKPNTLRQVSLALIWYVLEPPASGFPEMMANLWRTLRLLSGNLLQGLMRSTRINCSAEACSSSSFTTSSAQRANLHWQWICNSKMTEHDKCNQSIHVAFHITAHFWIDSVSFRLSLRRARMYRNSP